ncbi:hypothetical protein CPC08DRAFT_361252 [Agrocybe pediades]|nr:hypothetical protein CPC08DRAFT_361252 [Agrocybe pediades]
MLRSQSSSSTQADFFAQYNHLRPDVHLSSKRVPRVFRNPDRMLDPSVHDWSRHNDLASASSRATQSHSSSPYSPNVSPFTSYDGHITPPRVLRPNKRNQPDEAAISSFLLSSSFSCSSDEDTFAYPASPLAKAVTSSTSGTPQLVKPTPSRRGSEPTYPASRSTTIRRAAQQSEERRPMTKKRRSDSDATYVEVDSVLSTPTRRARSETCCSAETVVDEDEDGSYSPKSKGKEPIRRGSLFSEPSFGPRTIEQVEDFRRRISRRKRAASPRVYTQDEGILYHDVFEADEEFVEEDADEDVAPRKESPVAAMFSAVRHQYVAAGLTVQFALHRAEKKMAKRWSERGTRS